MLRQVFVIFCVLFTLIFFAVQGFVLLKPHLPESWTTKPVVVEKKEVVAVPTVMASSVIPEVNPLTFGKVENPQRIYQPLVAQDYNGTLSEKPQKLTCDNGKAYFETGSWTLVYVVSESPGLIISSQPDGGTVKITCPPSSRNVVYVFAKHP